MKKILKLTFIAISIIFIIISFDLYIFRGYFSDLYLFPFRENNIELKEIQSENLELKVLKEKEFYNIKFKNKSLKPFFTSTYRWDTYFPVNDSIFSFHYRAKSFFNNYKDEYNYNVSCGTGLGYFSINPLEEFNNKIKYKNLIKTYLNNYHYPNQKSDTIMDLIYNKPLLVDNNEEIITIERNDITYKDSIDFKLYIPVFNYNHTEITYVKSNSFKVAYKDIIESYIEEKKEYIKEFN